MNSPSESFLVNLSMAAEGSLTPQTNYIKVGGVATGGCPGHGEWENS